MSQVCSTRPAMATTAETWRDTSGVAIASDSARRASAARASRAPRVVRLELVTAVAASIVAESTLSKLAPNGGSGSMFAFTSPAGASSASSRKHKPALTRASHDGEVVAAAAVFAAARLSVPVVSSNGCGATAVFDSGDAPARRSIALCRNTTASSERGGNVRKGTTRNVLAKHVRTSASAVGCAASAAVTYTRSPLAAVSMSFASRENAPTARPKRIAAAAASRAAGDALRCAPWCAASVNTESVVRVDALWSIASFDVGALVS
mmetsp:Transcript_1898/g.7205  ORF Transcript_1898/g.7205 Transcript_1898/m.7205 type:complete len:265 (-) Transcript_1898:1108-1902(-)